MADMSVSNKKEPHADKDGGMKAALAESGLVVDFLRCTEKFKNYYYTGEINDYPTDYVTPAPSALDGGDDNKLMKSTTDRAVRIGNRRRGMIILAEAKSHYESDTGIQVWRQIHALQDSLFEKIVAKKERRLHKADKKYKYRLTINSDTIPDVVCMGIYTGKRPWGKTSILDMKNRVTTCTDLEPEARGASVWLVDVRRLTDEQIARGGPYVKAFAEVLKAGTNITKLDKAIQDNISVLQHFPRGLIIAMCNETGFKELGRRISAAVAMKEGGKEVVDVCEVWEKMKKAADKRRESEVKELNAKIKESKNTIASMNSALQESLKSAGILKEIVRMKLANVAESDILRSIAQSFDIAISEARHHLDDFNALAPRGADSAFPLVNA